MPRSFPQVISLLRLIAVERGDESFELKLK
jgi:hypothetical protein